MSYTLVCRTPQIEAAYNAIASSSDKDLAKEHWHGLRAKEEALISERGVLSSKLVSGE